EFVAGVLVGQGLVQGGGVDGLAVQGLYPITGLEAGLGGRGGGVHFLDDGPAALVGGDEDAQVAGLALVGGGPAEARGGGVLDRLVVGQVRGGRLVAFEQPDREPTGQPHQTRQAARMEHGSTPRAGSNDANSIVTPGCGESISEPGYEAR